MSIRNKIQLIFHICLDDNLFFLPTDDRVVRDDRVFAALARKVWEPDSAPLAHEWTVGVMGLGVLGRACAGALKGMGFNVIGWSRTPKEYDGGLTFDGLDGLEKFLNRTQILICLLPLTPETHGVLGRGTFNRLPSGAAVINVGRGAHLVEEDLIALQFRHPSMSSNCAKDKPSIIPTMLSQRRR